MLELNFDPFPLLETERLILRRIALSDAEDYFALRSNVDAMKHIAKPVQRSIEETKTQIYKRKKVVVDVDASFYQKQLIIYQQLHQVLFLP